MIEMTLAGVKEVEAKLVGLERKVAKKLVRTALRAAAKPIQLAAKSNAIGVVGGKMGGLLAGNLQVRAFKKQRPGQYGLYVGLKPDVDEFVSRGQGYGELRTKEVRSLGGQFSRAYIPNAIEYGHAFPGRGGKNAPKDVPAMPYMRPAMDSKKDESARVFWQILWSSIERTARAG